MNYFERSAVVLAVILAVAAPAYFFGFPKLRMSYLEYRAGETIAQIEAFRAREQRLPAALTDLGAGEYDWLDYQPSGAKYTLAFYAGSYWYMDTYDSETKDWHIRD